MRAMFAPCTILLILIVLLGFAPETTAADLKFVGDDDSTGGALAVVAPDGPLIHTAQFLPVDKTGAVLKKDARTQIGYTLADVLGAIEAAGGNPERVIRFNITVADPAMLPQVKDAIMRRLDKGQRPTIAIVVGQLPLPGAMIGIDAVAPAKGTFATVKQHTLADFPPAFGGAHAATLPAGRRVYVAGQAEKGDTPADATRKTLASLRATLKWLELTDAHVVQCKAFLKPISAATEVTKEFVAHFGAGKVPPLVFVEWESNLPIEIELIATAPGDAKPGIEFLTPPGMTASPVYSRVVRASSPEFIYTAGLVAPKPGSGNEQVNGIYDRLRTILKETGSDLNHLAKATYYVTNDESSTALNILRPSFYDPKRPPAASKAMVPGTGFKDRALVVDLIAVPAK